MHERTNPGPPPERPPFLDVAGSGGLSAAGEAAAAHGPAASALADPRAACQPACASPPPQRISSALASAASRRRSRIATVAPAADRPVARAPPSTPQPPVTTAMRPVSANALSVIPLV